MRSALENIDPGLAPFQRRRWHPETLCWRSARRTATHPPGGSGVQSDGWRCTVLAMCSRSLYLSSCSAPPGWVTENSGARCYANIDNSTAEFCDIQASFLDGCEISQCLVRRLRTIGSLNGRHFRAFPYTSLLAAAPLQDTRPKPGSMFGYGFSSVMTETRCNERSTI